MTHTDFSDVINRECIMPTEKSVTYTLYQFDELDDQAKEKARDWYRQSDAEFFDADHFMEQSLVEPAAYFHRVKTDKCTFSLNYCQGDGVTFYGRFDLDFFMADPGEEGAPEDGGKFKAEREALQGMVRKLQDSGHTVRVNIELYRDVANVNVLVERPEDGPDLDALKDEFEDGLTEYLKRVSKDVERLGYLELDYQSSAENVDENIRINEYTFDKEGNRLKV